MKKNIICFLLSVPFLFESCVRYHPPALKTPSADQWKAPIEKTDKSPVCPEPVVVYKSKTFRPWWEVFDDSILNDLEMEACANSPSVASAASRLEEAKALYIIARSSLFPEVNLNVSAARQRLSGSQLSSSSAAAASSTSSTATSSSSPVVIPSITPTSPSVTVMPTPPTVSTSTTVPKPKHHITELLVLPELTYELDFWGKHYQETAAAWDRVAAQEEDLETALLILTTSVASAYLDLRTMDQEIDVLVKTEKSRQSIFELQQKKFEAGLINDLDTMQAKVLLKSVQAELENTKLLRAITENTLAVLVGASAPDFTVAPVDTWPSIPVIPPGLPISLLKTRPEIRQAQKLLEAAVYDVGVAKSNFFPTVDIALSAGYESNKFHSLFKWKNHVWSAAIDALTPIFNAGRISSQVKAAIARYEQNVAAYIQTILTAFGDVENALSSVEAKKKQLEYLNEEVSAAQSVYRISSLRYNMGLVDYLTVVDAERSLLESERQQVIVTRDQYSSIVSLVKSLGGVWTNEKEYKME